MRTATIVLAAIAGLVCLAASGPDGRAAPSPYAGQELREVKALSAEEMRALEVGEGMGLAKAAELNRYPGPRHVLDLAEPLALTAAQRESTEKLFSEMHAEAVSLGQRIVSLERQLDQGFRTRAMDEATLARLTGELGELQGRLRASHLRAHLRLREILTPDQVERYQVLRGYGSAASGMVPDSHPHHLMHPANP